MISYRIDGPFPLHYSTATLVFSDEEPTVNVGDIIANLGYTYGDKVIYPIQVGENLVWVCERDDTGKVLVQLTAPYRVLYRDIEVQMPRGMLDKISEGIYNFNWADSAADPIIARSFIGDANLTINFSQVVTASEITSFVKIAGRNCYVNDSRTLFIWKDEDPEHETPLTDITAGYVPQCDTLTVLVPNDSKVDTIQWIAAEPIPIEQMYHKKDHRPFFPKTAFGAVVDHNGNTLSTVMTDMIERVQTNEEDIDELEKAIGGKIDFNTIVYHKEVSELPDDLTQDDADKTLYHLNGDVAEDNGYYIYSGPVKGYTRIDNQPSEGRVKDVYVNGESVLDVPTGIAHVNIEESEYEGNILVNGYTVPVHGYEMWTKAQMLTQEEYDALTVISPVTFYCITKTDEHGETYVCKLYLGTIPFGKETTGFILDVHKLDVDRL